MLILLPAFIRGRTPLHLSAWNSHLEVSLLLLQCGADVNAKDKEYLPPSSLLLLFLQVKTLSRQVHSFSFLQSTYCIA
jgi:ankyrin repeat protein